MSAPVHVHGDVPVALPADRGSRLVLLSTRPPGYESSTSRLDGPWRGRLVRTAVHAFLTAVARSVEDGATAVAATRLRRPRPSPAIPTSDRRRRPGTHPRRLLDGRPDRKDAHV